MQLVCVESVWQPHFTIFRRSGGATSLVISMYIIHFLSFSILNLKHTSYYPLSTPLSDNLHKEYIDEKHLKLDLVSQVLLWVSQEVLSSCLRNRGLFSVFFLFKDPQKRVQLFNQYARVYLNIYRVIFVSNKALASVIKSRSGFAWETLIPGSDVWFLRISRNSSLLCLLVRKLYLFTGWELVRAGTILLCFLILFLLRWLVSVILQLICR